MISELVFQVMVYGDVWVLATLLAAMEVEVEGEEGWAYRTATWYRLTGYWYLIFGRLQGNKPATGYHFFLNCIVWVVSASFIISASYPEWPSLQSWLAGVARYMVFMPLWDYTWFVLNPAYVGKTDPDHVWWHGNMKWIGPTPWSNVASFFGSLVVAFFAGIPLVHLCGMTFVLMLLGLVKFFAPRYHAWRLSMLSNDERCLTERYKRDL